MRFSEMLNRITGISCPIFGVSWNPAETERTAARRIIVFLEPRRVLYSPSEFEVPEYCVESVLNKREYLTSELQKIDEKSKLNLYVRSMRNACNVFLNRCPTKERFGDYSMGMGTLGYMIFAASIGELRGNFGVMIGQIAKAYGIDVEDKLAQIIPT